MQYNSFLEVPSTESVQVILKMFRQRKAVLLSGAFSEAAFEMMDHPAICELETIAAFEYLLLGGSKWDIPGSPSMTHFLTQELFRRGFDLEFRSSLFRHALSLSDAVFMRPEVSEAKQAA